MEHFIHYGLHILLPLSAAIIFCKEKWWKVWGIMMLGMLIDVDHLWAQPIYDPQRCSIGFHTFHTWPFFIIYTGLIIHPKTRWFGWGVCLHLITDLVDCYQHGTLINT
jgi:hypothetical protein